MDPPGILVAALWLLLRRHHELLRASEHADEPVRSGRAAGDEREPTVDPAAGGAEPAHPRAVPPTGGDHADVLRRAAVPGQRGSPPLPPYRVSDYYGQSSLSPCGCDV